MGRSRKGRSRSRANSRCFRLERIEPRLLLASIAGKVFEDIDGNGTQEAGESNLSGWTIFLDTNSNNQLDTTSISVSAGGLPKSIPDVGTTNTTLTVSGHVSPISRITVSLNITHTWDADMDVFLTSPAGTRVELFTDVGSNGHGFDVTLDDFSSTLISAAVGSTTAPITGSWKPEGSLASIAGESANGTWTLQTTDDATGDTGTLNSFFINFIEGERAAITNSVGQYTFSNLSAGTYFPRQVVAANWEQTFPTPPYSTVLANASSAVTDANFGDRQPPGQISGHVFADYDLDGAQDVNEPGLANWLVYLDTNNNGLPDSSERQMASDASGAYLFSNVKPGSYVVREVLPQNWAQTSPTLTNVAVTPTGIAVAAKPARDMAKSDIVVAFKGKDGLSQLRSQSKSSVVNGYFDPRGSKNLFSVGGLNLVDVYLPAGIDPQKAADRFAKLSGVQWAQPNYIYNGDPRDFTPDDPSYASQYQHTLMQNNLAWDTTLGSSNVIIAITDDGIDITHPDLAASIWTNPGEIAGNGIDDDHNGFVDDVHGWDFSSNDNNPNPVSPDYHGTHVAGIAAARTNNGVGVSGTAGGATIMPIRFYGSGAWTSTVISNSFHYAADNGAKILSTSYNIDQFAGDAIFTAAVQYVYDHGLLYFNSAGNDGALNPARQGFDQALFVANTTSTDIRSSSSNYGYGIDLSAPGTSIYSTLPGGIYGTLSGTSMATPNAAGSAALIWSAHPTWTRDQVAAQLIGSADNIDSLNPSYAGLLGSGRVNSYRGVTQTLASPRIKSLAGLPAEGNTINVKPTAFTLDVANVFNPATVKTSAFELRGNGNDNIFNTADDTLIALSLNTNYMIGTNRLSFSITGAMSADSYRFSALPTLTDPFGQSIDGNGNGVGGDAYTRNFNFVALTNSFSMTVASNKTTFGNFGNRNAAGPKVTTAAFDLDAGNKIRFGFDEDVSAGIGSASLILHQLGSADALTEVSSYTIAYDAAQNTGTFTLSGLTGPTLADGDYVVTLGGVQDGFGNSLSGYQLSFFVYVGDANHNRTVDVDDLYIVASNWLQTGRSFSQGDFNYDGIVDGKDLGILSVRWQQSLQTTPPPAVVANSAPQEATSVVRRSVPRTPARPTAQLSLSSPVSVL